VKRVTIARAGELQVMLHGCDSGLGVTLLHGLHNLAMLLQGQRKRTRMSCDARESLGQLATDHGDEVKEQVILCGAGDGDMKLEI
jgi:hypothetical protein